MMKTIHIILVSVASLVVMTSCGKNPTSAIDQARESLVEVHDNLQQLEPVDKYAAERFLVIRERVHDADSQLVKAQKEIDALKAEVNYLKNPEDAGFPQPEPSDTRTIWQKAAFWRTAPTTTTVPNMPMHAEPAQEQSWAFWR